MKTETCGCMGGCPCSQSAISELNTIPVGSTHEWRFKDGKGWTLYTTAGQVVRAASAHEEPVLNEVKRLAAIDEATQCTTADIAELAAAAALD